MSNKKQRIGWNLTKLAAIVDPADTRNGLYELAKDAGYAMIDGKKYGIDQYVFVPQEKWDAVAAEVKRDRKYGITNAEQRFANCVDYWYHYAQKHQF